MQYDVLTCTQKLMKGQFNLLYIKWENKGKSKNQTSQKQWSM